MSRRGVGGMKVTVSVPVEDDIRALRRGAKEGAAEAVRHWNRTMAPQHFKRGAGRRYGYAPRSIGYTKRKKRVHGHDILLVYSGETREMVSTRFQAPTVRRVKGLVQARVRLQVPDYFYKHSPGSPDKVAELLLVTDKEAGQLIFVMMKFVDRNLQQTTVRKERVRA